jgi:hypothetical protein
MLGPLARRCAAACLAGALAPSAAAQVAPYWNAQWGRPESASVSLGVLAGRIKGDSFRIATRAWLLEARAGTDAGALHVGFAPFAATSSGFPFAGVALKGTLLRTWGSPSGSLGPRQGYAGAELHAAWIVKGSIGVLWRISGNVGPTSLLTWSVGIGL